MAAVRGKATRLRCTMLALLAAVLTIAAPGAGAAPAVYTVARMEVDATAKDAVTAKEQGLAKAQQRALRIVLSRVAPFASQDRLPQVDDALVQDLLDSLAVRRETNSATRYIASLDFAFRPDAVRALLSGYGMAVIDEQAPPIKLLPVLVIDGQVASGPRDVWSAAWAALDLAHALAPVDLLRPQSDLGKPDIDRIFAGDEAGFQALRRQYAADSLLLAVAELSTQDGVLVTRLYGGDAAGPIDLVRKDRLLGSEPASTAATAARIALRILESRWKLSLAGGSDGQAGTGEISVAVAVEFSGLREWQAIRSRLLAVPGVRGLTVQALTARSATVAFRYTGSAERLTQQLASRQLALEQRGGTWVLIGR